MGTSMLPHLQNNDYVITSKLFSIKKNDVVVIKTRSFGLVVKRILKIKKNEIFLCGDNKNTYSSVYEIPHSLSNIEGRVFFKFRLPKFLNFKLQ
jgi:phage repressor protein C with HTH and peptisase S24 domain|tara:strand:- start:210 stop:491 length:282 start_codon:yes stop_codon:yes gene_type:complete